jgi:hypothetical protein
VKVFVDGFTDENTVGFKPGCPYTDRIANGVTDGIILSVILLVLINI